MSASHLQDFISQAKEAAGIELGIIDDAGLIIACSDEEAEKPVDSLVRDVLRARMGQILSGGYLFKKVYVKDTLAYIIYARSEDENDFKFLSLIAINLCNLKTYQDEKYDKNNFIYKIVTGDMPHGDILLKSKELHISYSAPRAVFLIKTEDTGNNYLYDIVQGLFPNKNKDFAVVLDNNSLALVKEFKPSTGQEEIGKAALTIVDTLNAELMIKVFIGIGTTVENLPDVHRSAEEARLALDIGAVFSKHQYIVSYNDLGIGRLIYQLPVELCEMFLREIFKGDSLAAIDPETAVTIQKFFENNLNISEASRQLYVHRNTLVYRLDKLQRLTGLDLRNFDDAVTFKVASLVKMYLDSIGKS